MYNSRMRVAIDIGNSSINIGFFIDERLIVQKLDTFPLKSPSEYLDLILKAQRENSIEKTAEVVIISSVVPGHTEALFEAGLRLSGKAPVRVGAGQIKGLRIDVKSPTEIGEDRLAASLAACELFGSPVAVVDFGTATTVNFVGGGDVFKGGAIMPGIGLMKEALFKKTAQLPDVQIRKPMSPIGKDTAESIISGIVYGAAGAIERIIGEAERADGESYKVVLTGGYAGLVSPFMKRKVFIEPDLTLKGLRIIYERGR
jgi:type III pantothenate kinase